LYNKARKSEITTRMKKVFVKVTELEAASACTDDDISGLESLISEATKAVDKAVARGVLHKNTGARRKARMAAYKKDLRVSKGLYTA
jgi:small subunit ribosomal protein S20